MRNAAIPWLSSSASTTLASMSEVVLKTTTGGIRDSRSYVGRCRDLIYLQQHQREVVLQPDVADKRADLAQDSLT